ncbi:MAG: hypothetical protein ABI481_00530 [Pyrinomonadaceae bacterium]
MYCPNCGQERISEVTSFCSRCDYLLTGTAKLLRTGGAAPTATNSGDPSPRSRGVRMGIFMFLLMFVIAPIIGLIATFGLRMEPWPVGIVVAVLGVGGILRIIYALMFESKTIAALPPGPDARELDPAQAGFSTSALPPQRDVPASQYAAPSSPAWRDEKTHEPTSVTDHTTKLLEKEQ